MTPGGPQGHHHGYTKRMLFDVLTIMGFGDFDVWSSNYPEAANGWLYMDDGEQLAISLNVSAVKKGPPTIDVDRLAEACAQQPMAPPSKIARELMAGEEACDASDALLYQRLHFKYIIERNERRRLEAEVTRLREVIDTPRSDLPSPSAGPGELNSVSQMRVVADKLRRGLRNRLRPAIEATAPAADAPKESGGGLGPWNYAGHPDQPFGGVSYAQFGEDLLLLNLFSALAIQRPSYLDIGAHHPVHCSNTALLYARGSRGVCVEANPNLVPAFAEMRPEDLTLNIGCSAKAGTLDFYMIDQASGRNTFDRATADAFIAAHPQFTIREVRQISVVPLDDIVATHCGGRWPDFLSLDVEGLDFAVLEASRITSIAGPKVICVEAVAGNDTDSTSAIERLLSGRGFVPAARTVANIIFCRREELSRWTKAD
jgi:FkbM family methyltransferase